MKRKQQSMVLALIAIALMVLLFVMDAFCHAESEVITDESTSLHVSDGTWYVTPSPDPTIEPTPEPTKEPTNYIEDCTWSKGQQDKIKIICNRYHVDYSLIMGMAYVESRFDENAIGDNGEAYGPWQVHPRIWKNVIAGKGFSWNDMHDPVKSAEVTCEIMKSHFERYDNIYFAVMAWNGGGDYAMKMLSNGSVSEYCNLVVAKQEEYEKGHH